MEITFLNVGHGDSIGLRWIDSGTEKIGLVDCKKNSNSIPTIEYLKSKKDIRNIDFIVLTHPHIDHYSGFPELFEYIKISNIRIKRFVHSLHGDPKYLNWAEKKSEDRKKLQNIIDTVIDFKDNLNIIENIDWAIQNWSLELGENYLLRALSPSDSEIRTRREKIKYYMKENKYLCSSSSNYLSTILVVLNVQSNKSFLLSSDAMDFTFERLHKSKVLLYDVFSAIQIPHHGSSKSNYEKFWQALNYSNEKDALVSVGLNERYKLPDYEVIKFFDGLGFNIDITNYVNGFKEFYDNYNLNAYNLINSLDDDSESIVDEYPAKEFISSTL